VAVAGFLEGRPEGTPRLAQMMIVRRPGRAVVGVLRLLRRG
jgi:hypothetical protein